MKIFLILILMVFFVILLIYMYKKKLWILITAITSFLIGALIVWFFIASFEFSNDYEYYRTLVPLGALVVTTASLILTANTTKKNTDVNRDTRAETTFMNMLKLNNDLIKEADEEIFSTVLNEIKDEFFKDVFMINRGTRFINEYFDEYGEALIIELNAIDITEYISGNEIEIAERYREKYVEIIKNRPRRKINKLWFTINEMMGDYKVEITDKKVYQDPFTKILLSKTDFYKNMQHKYKNEKRVLSAPVSYKEMVIICDKIFKKYYGDLGHMFRNTHRIIKILNNDPIDDMKYSQFIGILRAQMSEEVLLVLFYNATYTTRGIGLGREFLGSGFFGNQEDFPHYVNLNDGRALRNYQEPQHFRLDSLILPTMDCEIMYQLYSKGSMKKSRVRKKQTNEDLFKKFEETFNKNQSNSFDKSVLKRRYLKYTRHKLKDTK